MKIVGINGSPRKNGNTAYILEAILKEAKNNGATTKTYHLNDMNIKGCQACYGCKRPGHEVECVIKDDMKYLLKEIQKADAVVFASPVYMWQMTAQAKLFTDRLMPLLKPNYTSHLSQQNMLPIYIQGNSDAKSFESYFKYTSKMFSFLGFRVLPHFVASGVHQIDDARNNPEIISKAKLAVGGLMMSDCF